MKVTKYEHACLVVEEQGKLLVIDPGIFSESLPALQNVAAVVVTHVHQDHFAIDKVRLILGENPEAQLITVQAVADELDPSFKPKVVTGGNEDTVGPFTLNFYGGQHAVIHASIPVTDNVGVFVNDQLYYPGDSFALPDNKPVPLLAVPASAPWMRVGEAIDFIASVKPTRVFPTHNAILSDVGAAIHYRLLEEAAAAVTSEFFLLAPTEETTV